MAEEQRNSAAPSSAELMADYRKLRKKERTDEALALIQEALRREQIADESIVQAGQMIAADLDDTDVKVFVVGQCTTAFFLPALTALGWSENARLEVREGHYDNVIQDLMTLDWDPDIVIVVPWHQRLLAGLDRTVAERVDEEIAFLTQAWNCIREKGAKLLQVGYDWMLPGAFGYAMSARLGGDVAVVRQMNEAAKEALPEGAFFVELDQISAMTGHAGFYDQRNYYWMKQPFSTAGLVALSRHLWAGARALTWGQKKLLVLDLDNTLWGGVVAETGPHEIAIGETPEGEAFRAFQAFVKKLTQSGVVLAVCSKNNPEDAREPFEVNPDMILKLDDFAAFEASWDPKPVAIRRIADELRLGLNSFVFFDDNPAEREHVRQQLPEVQVVEVPEDPSEFASALQAALSFEAATITEADAQRVQQYSEERQRRELKSTAGTIDDYLDSLAMVARVDPIDERNLTRAVQLITKTNQFNLTVRRHSAERVQEMIAADGAIAVALALTDKFGDYGVVSLVLAQPTGEEGTFVIDTWLMSCRSIGRTVEHYLMNHVAAAAREAGAARLLGEFIPAPKNKLVAGLYPSFGFTEEKSDDESKRYVLDLDDFEPLETHVVTADA